MKVKSSQFFHRKSNFEHTLREDTTFHFLSGFKVIVRVGSTYEIQENKLYLMLTEFILINSILIQQFEPHV